METVFTDESARVVLSQVQALHFDLIGLYRAEVGQDWSSHGKAEGDCLHHIDLVISGGARVRHRGASLDLVPGWAYFFPGNTPIVRECGQRYESMFLKFRCTWLSGFDPLLDSPIRGPVRLGRWDPHEWLDPLSDDRTPNCRLLLRWMSRLMYWFAEGLPQLETMLAENFGAHAKYGAVFKLIDEKLGADLRMDVLAKAYGTSLHAFSMAFARTFKQGPKAYLGRRINQEAIRLVLNSPLTMKEIAETLRFSDEYYFSRFFSNMNGIAPSRYRQQFRHVDVSRVFQSKNGQGI